MYCTLEIIWRNLCWWIQLAYNDLFQWSLDIAMSWYSLYSALTEKFLNFSESWYTVHNFCFLKECNFLLSSLYLLVLCNEGHDSYFLGASKFVTKQISKHNEHTWQCWQLTLDVFALLRWMAALSVLAKKGWQRIVVRMLQRAHTHSTWASATWCARTALVKL